MENNKGDSISRSALKREFETTPYNDYDDLLRTERLINDAPTIEQNWKFYYDHGYKQAERELKKSRENLANNVWSLYKKYQSSLATNVIEFGDELKELLRREEG